MNKIILRELVGNCELNVLFLFVNPWYQIQLAPLVVLFLRLFVYVCDLNEVDGYTTDLCYDLAIKDSSFTLHLRQMVCLQEGSDVCRFLLLSL